ncbi:hypothetical protein KKH03_03445 [Patescibacteria group bacterium]|nr:hypothetical protein [Patescibacteria group bacterium]
MHHSNKTPENDPILAPTEDAANLTREIFKAVDEWETLCNTMSSTVEKVSAVRSVITMLKSLTVAEIQAISKFAQELETARKNSPRHNIDQVMNNMRDELERLVVFQKGEQDD